MTETFVIRREGKAGLYSIGKEIVPGCAFFKAGDYDLPLERVKAKLAALQSAKPEKK